MDDELDTVELRKPENYSFFPYSFISREIDYKAPEVALILDLFRSCARACCSFTELLKLLEIQLRVTQDERVGEPAVCLSVFCGKSIFLFAEDWPRLKTDHPCPPSLPGMETPVARV